ncbi:MAG: DinB family protein [Actinomycetes bacterium]
MSRPRARPLRVCLETGTKRTFASALDWPGWARSGKGDEAALEALASYLPRYAPVAVEAGLSLPQHAAAAFDIVERLPGNATTDFGAPGVVADADAEPVAAKEATRQAALLEASWRAFDRIAAGAPESLRKGPRGGGRDTSKIVGHVVEAERSYARTLGLRLAPYAADDAEALAEAREALLEVLRASSDGKPLTPKGWPRRYAVRRIAWHVLDHAWEIEDRSDPAPP